MPYLKPPIELNLCLLKQSALRATSQFIAVAQVFAAKANQWLVLLSITALQSCALI